MTPITDPPDPLATLREYRRLAPWNIRDLSFLTGALLQASGIKPTSAAANTTPNERTIRYYVTRGLLAPPNGRGAAATYSYKHLLQLLAIKLRQMEGGTLAAIAGEITAQSGDTLERRVATALGPTLPLPSMIALRNPARARGRSAQAIHSWHALGEGAEGGEGVSHQFAVTKWHRIPIARGLELSVHEGHPLAKKARQSPEIANAVRAAVNRFLGS